MDKSSGNMPTEKCRHVAIIMDGNGRWAKQRHLPRFMGHKSGAKAVKRIVIAAQEYQIEVLTLYAFSTENWKRPETETSFLMDLLSKTIENEFSELINEGVRLSFIGDWQSLPDTLTCKIKNISEKSLNNKRLHLIIAINYGGRQEIIEATRKLSAQAVAGHINPADITEDIFTKELALADVPAVDLLIRTSGEMRLSNFLLWQLAYAEFYFTNTLWPDFNASDLAAALSEFSIRQRRFGGI